MNIIYKYGESNIKPELIDDTSSKFVTYIYKDIKEVICKNEITGEEYIMYEYKVAKLTKKEYKEYLVELNAKSTLAEINMLKECILELSEEIYG